MHHPSIKKSLGRCTAQHQWIGELGIMTAAVQSQTMNDQFKYKGLNKISKHVEMKSLKHSPSQSAPTILVLKQNMGCKKQGAKK